MKYQKKPVIIDAWKVNDFELDDKLPEWTFQAFVNRTVGETGKEGFDYYVNTLGGKMYFKNGDYLIKGVHGELYSCKPDVFEEMYVKLTAYDEIANLGQQAIMLNQKQVVDDIERMIPDEIGNDIHEFLHRGDK